jgi:hypothetical protein
MKKIKYFLIIFLHIISIAVSKQAVAQNDIQVSLSLLPPYSPYFSDYLVYENKTTLILTGPNAINRKFYLRGTVTGDNGITITTKQGFKPAQPLQFTGGPTLILKGIDLEEYFKWDNANVFGTDLTKLAQGDGLPEGNYTICIRAYDYTTNEPLSQSAPNGCVTISIKSVEPPIINLPRCGSSVTPNPAQNIVFSWNPPPGTPANTKYLLKIAEMQPGFSNYNDALNTLTTPTFYEKEISTSTFSYTLADAPLTVGKTYAFKVVAFDPTNKMNFRNNGESEVCYFTYGNNTTETTGTPILVKNKLTAIKLVPGIPTIKIKGKLLFAFHKSDEVTNQELFSTDAAFQKLIAKKGTGFSNKFSTAVTAAALANADPNIASQIDAAKNGSISSPTPVNFNVTGGYMQTSNKHVAAYNPSIIYYEPTPQESRNIKFSEMLGKNRYGYKNCKIKIYLYPADWFGFSDQPASTKQTGNSSNGKANVGTNTGSNIYSVFAGNKTTATLAIKTGPKVVTKRDEDGRFLLGVATTDEEGDFSIEVISKDLWKMEKGARISLEFEHDNFLFNLEDFDAPEIKNNEIDLGEHVGMAKTYKLNITTYSVLDDRKGLDEDNNVVNIKDATFRILRKKSVYNKNINLSKEANGALGKTKTEGDREVIFEGKIGETVPRLFFYNDNIQNSFYQLEIKHKEFRTKVKDLGVNDPNDYEETLQDKIINYTFNTQPISVKLEPPTFIAGTLAVKETEAPLPGLRIAVVNKSTDEELLSTVTDSAGTFRFDDIIADPSVKFKLKVVGDKIGEAYPNKEDGNVDINPQDFAILATGDKAEFKPLYLSAGLIAISGTVVNDENATISNAQLKWKQGGKSFFSGSDGKFLTSMIPGDYTLLVYKSGYKETEVKIKVEKPSGKNVVSQYALLNTESKNLTSTASIKTVKTQTKTPSALLLDLAGLSKIDNSNIALNLGYLNASQLTTNVAGNGMPINTKNALNVGNIVLKRFYVKVIVKDEATNAAIANALVQAKDDGKLVKTNANGISIINDAKGSAPSVLVEGPTGSLYIAKEAVFDIKHNVDTSTIEVLLKKGTAMQGKVLVGANGIKDAQVFVEGATYLKTTTDNEGNYTLPLPSGDFVVVASKSGLIGDKKEINITNQTVNHNFNLRDAGFDASSILGFAIELYESKNGANANEKIISGAFIKIPGNSLFNVASNFKLPFHNVIVLVQGNKAVPKDGEIKTDVSEIPFELFDYLPLKLKSSTGIKIKKFGTDANVGKIAGEAILNISSLVNKVTKLNFPAGVEIGLMGDDVNSKKEFTAFVSNGALPIDGNNLKLVGINSTDISIIFGDAALKLDLNKSFVFKNGIQFAGSAKFGSLPFIGNKTFLINSFKINTGGDVNFDIAVNMNEEINLSIWKMRLGMMRITDYGVTLGGSMGIEIPETDKISASFANVAISSSGISGGQFNLYSALIAKTLKTFEDKISLAQEAYNTAVAAGSNAINTAKTQLDNARKDWQNKLEDLVKQAGNEIELFKIIKYAPLNTTPFSIGKIPGTNNYKIQGAGEFGLSKFIDEKIKLDYFALATDGTFAFTIPVNIKKSFMGVADIELNKIGYDGFSKSFRVAGKVYLKIPGFGVGAGADISYFQAGRVEINEMNFKLAIGPIGDFEGKMKVMTGGFEGEGKIKIANAFGIGGKFVYQKVDDNGGVKFGVSFEVTPNPIIPVGVVNIGIKGGGFEINTARGQESIAVEVRGALSLIIDPTALVGINPLTLKITVGSGGPIIEGNGVVSITGMELGNAKLLLDFPNKYFTISAEGGLNINTIPAAPFKAEMGFKASLSLASGKEYFMIAMYQEINIANLFKQKTNLAFGWGIRKNQGTSEDKYLAFIPDYYLTNGKVFGFGFQGISSFGIRRENAWGFDIGVAALKVWYYNESEANFFGNFKEGKYGFKIANEIGAGGDARFLFIRVGVDVMLRGQLEGGYSNQGWYLGAELSGRFAGYAGDCNQEERDECRSINICTCLGFPCGLVICASKTVGITIDSRNGFRMRL